MADPSGGLDVTIDLGLRRNLHDGATGAPSIFPRLCAQVANCLSRAATRVAASSLHDATLSGRIRLGLLITCSKT